MTAHSNILKPHLHVGCEERTCMWCLTASYLIRICASPISCFPSQLCLSFGIIFLKKIVRHTLGFIISFFFGGIRFDVHRDPNSNTFCDVMFL